MQKGDDTRIEDIHLATNANGFVLRERDFGFVINVDRLEARNMLVDVVIVDRNGQ